VKREERQKREASEERERSKNGEKRVGRSKNLKKAIEYEYYNRDEIKEGGSPASP